MFFACFRLIKLSKEGAKVSSTSTVSIDFSKFWNDSEEFVYLVEQMPEDKLKQVFIDYKYGTYQRNIDGMIEHCYYHLGQIVLIKKLLLSN